MKIVFSVLFVFCFFSAVTQQKKTGSVQSKYVSNDTLHWNKCRKLTWDDFKCMPDSTSTGMAGTSSGFITKSTYSSDTTISVVIIAVFYKNKSWVKNEYMDSATLKHEQGHFDITEICARRANLALKNYKFNKATMKNDINKIFYDFVDEQNRIHDLYDKETTKPINNKKQREWDAKIAKWLQSNCE
ncbi:DUF922 domain-containing protein [Taibaiella chishuiensis]|uniref:DUF922 domain-containing protein n=1 Tax=Taibaiella chishuiensis TaxID=1434707 RepID=A0A2P8D7E9_9BACT|nr:hypothetical protein [Taibaiella chishuiensis]PSK93132.1 hypothetical protein B0I18_102101 [Taibaiella chishuiensis]